MVNQNAPNQKIVRERFIKHIWKVIQKRRYLINPEFAAIYYVLKYQLLWPELYILTMRTNRTKFRMNNLLLILTFWYQFSSVAQSCSTLWDPMDCSTTGFPVHHQLAELVHTHVNWIGDAIQLSHPL